MDKIVKKKKLWKKFSREKSNDKNKDITEDLSPESLDKAKDDSTTVREEERAVEEPKDKMKKTVGSVNKVLMLLAHQKKSIIRAKHSEKSITKAKQLETVGRLNMNTTTQTHEDAEKAVEVLGEEFKKRDMMIKSNYQLEGINKQILYYNAKKNFQSYWNLSWQKCYKRYEMALQNLKVAEELNDETVKVDAFELELKQKTIAVNNSCFNLHLSMQSSNKSPKPTDYQKYWSHGWQKYCNKYKMVQKNLKVAQQLQNETVQVDAFENELKLKAITVNQTIFLFNLKANLGPQTTSKPIDFQKYWNTRWQKHCNRHKIVQNNLIISEEIETETAEVEEFEKLLNEKSELVNRNVAIWNFLIVTSRKIQQ